MRAQWGKSIEIPPDNPQVHMPRPVHAFTGQECPWVQRVNDKTLITYYETLVSHQGDDHDRPQKRVTLVLSADEVAKLKELL